MYLQQCAVFFHPGVGVVAAVQCCSWGFNKAKTWSVLMTELYLMMLARGSYILVDLLRLTGSLGARNLGKGRNVIPSVCAISYVGFLLTMLSESFLTTLRNMHLES